MPIISPIITIALNDSDVAFRQKVNRNFAALGSIGTLTAHDLNQLTNSQVVQDLIKATENKVSNDTFTDTVSDINSRIDAALSPSDVYAGQYISVNESNGTIVINVVPGAFTTPLDVSNALSNYCSIPVGGVLLFDTSLGAPSIGTSSWTSLGETAIPGTTAWKRVA